MSQNENGPIKNELKVVPFDSKDQVVFAQFIKLDDIKDPISGLTYSAPTFQVFYKTISKPYLQILNTSDSTVRDSNITSTISMLSARFVENGPNNTACIHFLASQTHVA